MNRAPPSAGLCLIVDALAGPDWQARVAAAIEATAARTIILVAHDGEAIDVHSAGALVRAAQQRNVAALIWNDWRSARALAADGVHLTARTDIEEAYRAARAGLEPGSIVGVDAGQSRHDAMLLGELGADYVAFSQPGDATDDNALTDIVGWWTQIFVVPMVAFGADTSEAIVRLSAARPDFIAVRLPRDGDVKQWAARIQSALRAPSVAEPEPS